MNTTRELPDHDSRFDYNLAGPQLTSVTGPLYKTEVAAALKVLRSTVNDALGRSSASHAAFPEIMSLLELSGEYVAFGLSAAELDRICTFLNDLDLCVHEGYSAESYAETMLPHFIDLVECARRSLKLPNILRLHSKIRQSLKHRLRTFFELDLQIHPWVVVEQMGRLHDALVYRRAGDVTSILHAIWTDVASTTASTAVPAPKLDPTQSDPAPIDPDADPDPHAAAVTRALSSLTRRRDELLAAGDTKGQFFDRIQRRLNTLTRLARLRADRNLDALSRNTFVLVRPRDVTLH